MKTRGVLPLGQFLLLKFFLSHIPFVRASYSIVATDSETRQVGGAGATCLPGLDIYKYFYVSAPNRSVLHTQGLLMSRKPEDPIVTLAKEQMKEGQFTPQQVLDNMKDLDTGKTTYQGVEYTDVEVRQYAIADFDTTAVYSGSEVYWLWDNSGYPNTEIYNLAMTEIEDRYRFHAIGNVVANGTVAALQDGFLNPPSGEDDLAGRLMSAMQRVIQGGLGDVRCLQEDNTTATGAFLHVDNPDGTTFLHINIVDGAPPVADVQDAYLGWRMNDSMPGYVFESSGKHLDIFVGVWMAAVAVAAAII